VYPKIGDSTRWLVRNNSDAALENRKDSRMQSKFTKFAPQLSLALLCLSCLWVGGALRDAPDESRHYPAETLHPYSAGMQFAIADLDGDQKPDLAFVEQVGRVSAKTNYSIRLHLSVGVESRIDVDAPFGGLRVAARDVNGDENVDLIVTSTLDQRFIKVLLNDGHGNFSAAAPGAYPELQYESQTALNSPAWPAADHSTLASLRSSNSEASLPCYEFHTLHSSDSFPLTEFRVVPRRFAYSCQGRSPPLVAAHS
jgi:hypothetical protein